MATAAGNPVAADSHVSNGPVTSYLDTKYGYKLNGNKFLTDVHAGVSTASEALVLDANRATDTLRAKSSVTVGATGVPGVDGTVHTKVFAIAGSADTVATLLATITVPNANMSALLKVRYVARFDATPINDSTRIAEYNITINRKVGAAALILLSAVLDAQILTTGGGATFTTALTNGAVAGAVGAPNTFAINVANTGSTGSITTETVAEITVISNAGAGVQGVTVA